MKEVPKKEQAGVSGGLVNVPVVTVPSGPLLPPDPCTPTINDPLADGGGSITK